MPLRILYVMDPLARVLIDKDTTFAFMVEGERRGHEQYHCGIEDMFGEKARPGARVRRLHARREEQPHTLREARAVSLLWFDVIFMRKGPPVARAYYFATQPLYLVPPA